MGGRVLQPQMHKTLKHFSQRASRTLRPFIGNTQVRYQSKAIRPVEKETGPRQNTCLIDASTSTHHIPMVCDARISSKQAN